MMNILRADVYRLIRGKALYITFAVLLALNVMVVVVGAVGGVNHANQHRAIGIEMPDIGFNGMGSAALLYTRMDNIIFFLLPLVIAVAVAMFSNRTVRNDIAWGMSRTKLYLSKLILSGGLCIVLIAFYMGTGMLMATAAQGFGGPAPAGYWQNLFATVGAQTLAMLAVTSMGVFFSFLFKSSAAVTGIFMAFFLVPILVIDVLAHLVDPRFYRLLDFDLMFIVNRLGFFSQLETRVVVSAMATGAVYILATTIGGIALFNRAEIK